MAAQPLIWCRRSKPEVDAGPLQRIGTIGANGLSRVTGRPDGGPRIIKSWMQPYSVPGTPRATKSQIKAAVTVSVRQLDSPPCCVRRSGFRLFSGARYALNSANPVADLLVDKWFGRPSR